MYCRWMSVQSTKHQENHQQYNECILRKCLDCREHVAKRARSVIFRKEIMIFDMLGNDEACDDHSKQVKVSLPWSPKCFPAGLKCQRPYHLETKTEKSGKYRWKSQCQQHPLRLCAKFELP
mmetsp:Transcript_14785/g.32635  ORF Transcript_14785/g.32635 Transcript_14785/m.32635 type:complete len:121 (+) Transcript_14785:323-685(+)